MPSLMQAVVLSVEQLHDVSFAFLLGFLVRVLFTFGFSGLVALQYREVTSWAKVFMLGAAFSALLSGFITASVPQAKLEKLAQGASSVIEGLPYVFSRPTVAFAQSPAQKAPPEPTPTRPVEEFS
jgi:hypothetical protein